MSATIVTPAPARPTRVHPVRIGLLVVVAALLIVASFAVGRITGSTTTSAPAVTSTTVAPAAGLGSPTSPTVCRLGRAC
jgi:hypothetical protein